MSWLSNQRFSQGPPVWEIAVQLAVACDVYDGVFFVLSFFPRGVLDEILNLIESVSEVFFPTLAQATAALTKLKPIWRDNISLGSKVKLMHSLVISIFLYACESWTLTAE